MKHDSNEQLAAAIPINCLRCRHCQLLPESDLSRAISPDGTPNTEAIIPIRCLKVERKRPMHLWTACPIASAKHPYYRSKDGRSLRQAGDKTHACTPIERKFFALAYPILAWELLVKVTGRPKETLNTLAYRRGLSRSKACIDKARIEALEKSADACRESGLWLTPEQSEYIIARHRAGVRWESFGGLPPERVWPQLSTSAQQNQPIKDDIIAEVAKRGPRRSWDTIRRHPNWKSPQYQSAKRNMRRSSRGRGHEGEAMQRYDYARRMTNNGQLWRVNDPKGNEIAQTSTERAGCDLARKLNRLRELRVLLAVSANQLALCQAAAILRCEEKDVQRKIDTCLAEGYEL